MKVNIKAILTLLIALMSVSVADAYNFKVNNIYYNITSSSARTASVTFQSTSFNSYSGNVAVPSTVTANGVTYTVTAIGMRAFYNCPNLLSVSIPSSVKKLEDDAFGFCSSLQTVSLANSITSIGANAFYMCSKLSDVTLPASVKELGDYAFRYCNSLTTINIPKTLTSIGYCAFGDCFGVKSITVEDGNPTYDSRNNCNALIDTKKNRIFTACSNSTIPYGVEVIGSTAFYNMSALQKIDIPNSVTTIESMAFSGCTNLTSLTIPNSVTTNYSLMGQYLDDKKY